MSIKELKELKKQLHLLKKEQIQGWHKVDIDSVIKNIDNMIWKKENMK